MPSCSRKTTASASPVESSLLLRLGHGAACHFIGGARQRYGVAPTDRLSQTFDLTFDLSVFDMFVAWWAGACLCCPSDGQKIDIGIGAAIAANRGAEQRQAHHTGSF